MEAKALCQLIIRRSRLQFAHHCEEQLKFANNKHWWKLVKSVAHSNKTSCVPPFKTADGQVLNGGREKAEVLNNTFIANAHLNDNGKVPSRLEQKTNNFISSIMLWHKTVIRKLRNINSSKASGADGISAKVLKNCAPDLAPVLPVIQHLANHQNSYSRMENGSCGSCTKERKEIRLIRRTIDQSPSYKLSQKLWRALPVITSESIWTNINFSVTPSIP